MTGRGRTGRALAAILGMVWGLAVVAKAQAEWYEETKLLASHGQTYANFGQSVAIDGNVAIVGAFREAAYAPDSGAAYIFQDNGYGWSRVSRLAPGDGASSAEFGISVAVSGNTAIVGAYRDRENGLDSGAAYIFEDTGSGWEQVAKLMASDGTGLELFGRSVAISGSTAVVGAIHDADSGEMSGSAYVFRDSGSGWEQVVKLLPADPAQLQHFGSSVAIRGNTAIVGAFHDHQAGWRAGSAYVFQDTGSGWEQVAKLLPDGEPTPAHFGSSVSLDGGTAVIGATGHQDDADLPGSAYIFRQDGPAWTQVARLQAFDGTESASFGRSVSISGDTVLVGARTADPVGSVYVFQDMGSTWAPVTTLFPHDGEEGDRFGSSVALSYDTAVVGADFDADAGYRSGSAYIFVVPEPTTMSLLVLGGLCLLLWRSRPQRPTVAQTVPGSSTEPGARGGRCFEFDAEIARIIGLGVRTRIRPPICRIDTPAHGTPSRWEARIMWKRLLRLVCFLLTPAMFSAGALAAEVLVGTAQTDITPNEPVAVSAVSAVLQACRLAQDDTADTAVARL